MKKSTQTVAVFGASGHTGRFVVAELLRRGRMPILSGRDSGKLNAVAKAYGREFDIRPASITDPASLDRALDGAAAVINCAGPFAGTSAPVIEAALRAKIHYLDVAAEVEAVSDVFEQYADRAREAGIVIMPAAAFYGGLGDLLVTAAIGDWAAADEISLAYALDSWHPTLGTRNTSQTSKQRRGGRRLVFSNNQMELRTGDAPISEWTFPEPFGLQTVVGEFTTADSITIPRHLKTSALHTYMTLAPLKDLFVPDTAPVAADESGRSSQIFLVEAVVRSGDEERRAVASGRDIYAVTAPIVVEAAERILGRMIENPGVVTAGELFDAVDFLSSLSPESLLFNPE